MDKLNLVKTLWWWQSECNDEWIPDSMTIFGCQVKNRPLKEHDELGMWVGS